MPLIIAIVYLPIYCLFTVIGIIIGSRIASEAQKVLIKKRHYTYLLVGYILSTIISLVFILGIIEFGNNDWEAVLVILSITILGPFSIGSCILLLFDFFKKDNAIAILRSLSAGAFLSITAVLALTILGAYYGEKAINYMNLYYYNVVNHGLFSEVCQNANIVIIEDVDPAKSIALLPDSFVHINRGVKSTRLYNWKLPNWNNRKSFGRKTAIGNYSLNLSVLDYIERPPPRSSKLYGKSKYETLKTIGKRILKRQYSASGKREYTKYDIIPTSTISAEYSVTPVDLEIPNVEDKGIMGERIEIRRISDNELIAYVQYYYDMRTYNICPESADDPFFVYNFIDTALKIDNPSRYTD